MAKRPPAAPKTASTEPRRDKDQRLLVTLRDLERSEGLPARFCAAVVPPSAGPVVYGPTPRAALTELLGRYQLGADMDKRRHWAPYGGEAHRLLSIPFKRPGQNPGGKPRRDRSSAQDARITIGLTPLERDQLKRAALERGFSEAELCRQGLRTLGVLPGTEDPSP